MGGKHHPHFLSSLAVKTQIRTCSIPPKRKCFSDGLITSKYQISKCGTFMRTDGRTKKIMFLLYCRSFISSTTLQLLLPRSFYGTPPKKFIAFILAWEDAAAHAASHPRTNMFSCSNLLWQPPSRQLTSAHSSLHLRPLLASKLIRTLFPSWYQSPLQKTFPQVLSADVQTCRFPCRATRTSRSSAGD